jgi:CheY-like chemotaxis protein
VLANLLTNAAKYTDTGGRIPLSGRVENGGLTLTVKDNGIGISAQALPRVFEMFSQAEDALTRSEGGLGIGLALVKGLVELHGGSVEARSSGTGAGSEFILHLPIAPAAAAAPPAQEGSSAHQTGKRVLVADDNRDAAESLGLLLEMAGHDVRIVHDGRAALELAGSFRPHWALLDIGMPQLNGYEVAAAVRKESWGADMHLIALTGWGQDGDRQRAIAAGFDRHLTKPVDPDALLALI